MRKILIPTDFSENAMNAIKYALELFKYEISEFYFMHAYEDEVYNNDALLTRETFDNVLSIVSKNSQNNLEDTLKQVKEISPNPRHSYNIISSNSSLIDEADIIVDEKNIDIIIMGTKGETDDRKLTFGSHTLQVLKYVQCPVLSIPVNYKYTQPKHILFPTNYLIPYKRRDLKLLCKMAASYRAIIDMLYISRSVKLSIRQEDNKQFIKDAFRENETNFNIVNNKNFIEAINTYIEENNIDMLVMVNTRHSFLENILFQSAVDKLSLNIRIPFLALQNMRRD
ncbi:MAG: universal stress protein [Flavobacteriaceae bacterium]|nr:universal stress protein [Flavobacteriaceae bacterium]